MALITERYVDKIAGVLGCFDRLIVTGTLPSLCYSEGLKQRGEQPGLVWVFSALEPCTTYQPRHDKARHHTFLRYDDGKCLHYYFYFID